MLLKGAAAVQALARPDPAIRLFVLGGEDEAGSRALQASLAAAMGGDAERIDLSPVRLREDPAALADEAASIGLFGGRRWISVAVSIGGGDELVTAAQNLLAAPAAGNPAVVVGASIGARSRLFKLAEGSALAVAVISYAPDARAAGPLVDAVATPLGLRLGKGVARAIFDAGAGDRGVIAREVEKLALYVDAAPDAPRTAELSDWAAIGAELSDEDIGDAIDIVLGGRMAALPAMLAGLEAGGASAIPLLRGLARRGLQLAELRASVDGGRSAGQVIETAGRAIFWKEKEAIAHQLARWDSARLARLIDRVVDLERAMKAPDNAGTLLLRAGLLDMARAASAGDGGRRDA